MDEYRDREQGRQAAVHGHTLTYVLLYKNQSSRPRLCMVQVLRREMRARQMKGVVLTRAGRGPALGDCSSPTADTLRYCHTPLK